MVLSMLGFAGAVLMKALLFNSSGLIGHKLKFSNCGNPFLEDPAPTSRCRDSAGWSQFGDHEG